MGCNCGKKKPTPTPVSTPEPETIEKFHAKEMDAYAKRISEETIDWFDNIDVIKPIDDDE
jgi:hypothetical protein